MKKHTDEFVRADGESGFKSLGGPARLLNALKYSWNGLREAVRVEAALRQELCVCALLIPVAIGLPVTPLERVLLIASLVWVLIVELLNSALEAVVDRISFEIHDMSRRAKDFGSAAVFLSLCLAAGIWGYLAVPILLQFFK